jgi:hypothetical protein
MTAGGRVAILSLKHGRDQVAIRIRVLAPDGRAPAARDVLASVLRYILETVRRDEAELEPQQGSDREASRCTSPAGASPVRVSAGAPGSRPQARGEIPAARAGCRKPLRREQERGPQHEVKPAASSEEQRGSRAARFTAKATSDALRSGSARASGPPGVWGAARVQGEVRNTRGPSAPPSSRQGGPYKPSAKAGAAQRESEGIMVPSIAATKNAAGGKGPCGGRVGGGGKREGMVLFPKLFHGVLLTLLHAADGRPSQARPSTG